MSQKKKILLICLACAFVILLTLTLLGKFVFKWFDDPEEEPYVAPELLEGESYYYFGTSQIKDVILMFPQKNRSDIFEIMVHNSTGDNYYFLHEQTGSNNYFLLGQSEDESFEISDSGIYYPKIISALDTTFDYTSLYDDTSTIPAMLAATGTIVINNRIFPEEGEGWSETWLHHYGLSSSDNPAYFVVVPYLIDADGNYIFKTVNETETSYVGYNGDDGKYYYITAEGKKGAQFEGTRSQLTPAADESKAYKVYVGNSTIDDNGYYIYLEGREIVYTTNSAYLNDIVERDISYYVAPRLVTASESSYAFRFTPLFSVEKGVYVNTNGEVIPNNATVGLTTTYIYSFDSENYTSLTQGTTSDYFEVIDLTDEENLKNYIECLTGKTIGGSYSFFVEKDNLTYKNSTVFYNLSKVEGVVRNNEYLTTGTVLAGDQVLVRYADGTKNSDSEIVLLYGYVNLVDSTLPTTFKTALIGKTIGETFETIEIEVDYSTISQDQLFTREFRIDSIDQYVNANGVSDSTVSYGGYVVFTYTYYENNTLMQDTNQIYLPVPLSTDFNDQTWWISKGCNEQEIPMMKALIQSMLGKTVGSYIDSNNKNTLIAKIEYAKEWVHNYNLYVDAKPNYYTVYEKEIEFQFTNDADVYYGTTSYVITNPTDKTIYGLDGDAATKALEIFEDLVGDSTVKLGLDEKAINDYKLYSNRLIYALPFNCYGITDDRDYTDYYFRSSVTYTLYVSNKNADGSRYVGSDLYDLVVYVEDGSTFDFVDYDFATEWVHNTLLMVNYAYLRGMVFDLNFTEEEYNHVYAFDICVDQNYEYVSSYTENGETKYSTTILPKLYASYVDGGAHVDGATYQNLRSKFQYSVTTNTDNYSQLEKSLQKRTKAGVFVQTVNDSLRYITTLQNGTDLDALYEYTKELGKTSYDGTYNLQSLLYILNTTRYWGAAEDDLTESEINTLISNPDNCSMTLALTLCDEDYQQYGYTLKFYNYGMHSLVQIKNEQNSNTSQYFFIQTREVRKIAQSVLHLVHGEFIDIDQY